MQSLEEYKADRQESCLINRKPASAFCIVMKRISNILAALLLATLFVACSGQKELSGKGGFNIVGVWQLVQEEWINGIVITEGFEHYKICYDDQTFLDLRCHPEDDDDFFCAVNGGQYFLQDSVYQQVGADWSGRLVNDTIMKVFYPDKTQTWKAYPGISATTMADLKEETQGIQYINEKGHPLVHFFSLAKKRAEAERKAAAEKAAHEKAASQMANAFGKGNKMEAQGTTEAKAVGTQGTADGSPTTVASGKGGVGASYDLGGRGILGSLPIPQENIQDEGKVVVNITVDAEGNVIDANINLKTTTTNIKLRDAAMKAAKRAKFAPLKESDKQQGTITYNFKLR